ncbi:MAG: hypothetical protein WBV92_05270, partial [Nitrosotalea sp.]
MKEKGSSFLELAEDIFYNFSQIKPGSLNLVFSKKILFPVIICNSELEIIIPLPRKQDNKYLFEGILFDHTPNGRQNLWCLFLATIYHLAAHACVSRYSIYDSWKKSKTEDVCLRVIDCIEDISVERYISHTDSDVWENMKNINLKSMSKTQKNSFNSRDADLNFFGLSNEEKITKMRTHEMNTLDDALLFATLLYKNRELLPEDVPPYYERHDVRQILKTEQHSPDFEPRGSFNENAIR